MPPPLLAIDVGNTRVKIGWFDRTGGCGTAEPQGGLPVAPPPLPTPDRVQVFDPAGDRERLADWLAEPGQTEVEAVLASVNRPGLDWVVSVLDATAARLEIGLTKTLLAPSHLPIEVRVPEPNGVGIDRLAGAAAANRLRRPGRPAVVVDLGTAITVDLLSSDGGFLGGAILPGVAMAARALHQQTDLLPQRTIHELDGAPDAVGTNTADALDAGLFWGAVGAVREIVARQSDRLTEPPQMFVTGGAAPSVSRLLGGPGVAVRHVPDLVLSGIAIAETSAP